MRTYQNRLSLPFLLQWLGFVALGILGNYFSAPLFFGFDLIFGSIATLLVIALYGPVWGLLTAALVSSYTWYLWHHPWALLILIAEAATIGWLLPRLRGNFIFAAGLYWIFLGIPLVWFFYGVALEMDGLATWLVALKQAVNGVLNALIVNLILAYTPLLSVSKQPRDPYRSLFQSLFNAIVAAAILPALVLMTIGSRSLVNQIEGELRLRIDTASASISTQVERWYHQHLHAVQNLAEAAKELGLQPSEDLQRATHLIRSSKPDFHNMYVANDRATTVSFDPPVNERGESTIGINFSDREYYHFVRQNLTPHFSDVFMGRGGIFLPIVTVTAPILEEGRFLGFALGALNLGEIESFLSVYAKETGLTVSIVDRSNQVVASSVSNLESLQLFAQPGSRTEANGSYFRRFPEAAPNPMERWRNSHLGRIKTLAGENAWQLIVEAPLAPEQAYLYRKNLQTLFAILFIVLAALLLAFALTRPVSLPLARLAEETTNLPAKLRTTKPISWPDSTISEIRYLVANFQTMTEALKSRFAELESFASRLTDTNRDLEHEIQERQRVEEELRHSNRLKDEFLATLSHELRTPLNVILGYLELVRTEGLHEDTQEYLDAITRNAGTLNVLIKDILDVSRIITGKFRLERQPVDMRQVIAYSIESVRLAAEAKRIRIQTDLQAGDSLVPGDPDRLQQVLWNLLSNSIKFTPEGGLVRVSLKRKDSNIEIAVTDTGEGIHPDFLPYVFNRFLQEDGSLTRTHGGLGLGLALVRQIVELHGGTVRADSPGKNQGCTMTLTIPLTPELEVSHRNTPSESIQSKDQSPLNRGGNQPSA